jgi:hypothetical protein
MKHQERRKHQRVKVALTGRYMLQNRLEYSCQTLNMSPAGAALIAEMPPPVGEIVVAYVDHIGRLEGRCIWLSGNGFAMTVAGTIRRRDKLASQLTGFANTNALGHPEDRQHAPRSISPAPSRPETARRAREQETMKHPSSRILYAYWDTLRAGRAAPERGELDPGAIRAILGDVMILEGGGPLRYAVRLAGTRICSLMGREMRKRAFVEAFAPGDWPELYALLDATVASAAPTVANVIGETEDRRLLGLELLLLPLRHHGRTETRLLCSLAAHTRPYWATLMPLARLRLGSARFENLDATADMPAFGGSRVASNFRVLQGGRV